MAWRGRGRERKKERKSGWGWVAGGEEGERGWERERVVWGFSIGYIDNIFLKKNVEWKKKVWV